MHSVHEEVAVIGEHRKHLGLVLVVPSDEHLVSTQDRGLNLQVWMHLCETVSRYFLTTHTSYGGASLPQS